MPSWSRSWVRRIECTGGRDEVSGQLRFTNDDLKPVEPARRRWRHISYVDFWIADSFNVNACMIAAASVEAGLSWWQAWLSVWIGYGISGILVFLNGRVGAVYHIGFPVANRSSFGIWGSLWPVLNRAIMACFWYGVQSWIGGQCVFLMICSIWPSFGKSHDLTRKIALGGTVNIFISFVIFWLMTLPLIWFPVHQIRHLFTVKAIVAPTGGVALLIWVVARAASLGPVIDRKATIHGSDLAWTFVSAITAALANFATVIANNSDITRFAKTPGAAQWPQIIAIPIAFSCTSFIGIMVGSASAVIFPETGVIWNPLEVMFRMLYNGSSDKPASSTDRAGIFFIAASFVVAQLGVNIAANTISAGMDFTALLPRFINIRRGGYLCAIVGLAICPWQFLTSAQTFIIYLSAYGVFLSSIVGPMVVDYWLVRRRYLDIEELFSTKKSGIYFGVYGFQWRGYIAYICGISINIVGFAGVVGAKVPVAALYMYRLGFINGFLVSGAVYYLLSRLFVMQGCPVGGILESGDAENPFENSRGDVVPEEVEDEKNAGASQLEDQYQPSIEQGESRRVVHTNSALVPI